MRGVSGERIRKAPMVHKRGAGHRNEPRARSNSSVIVNSLRAPNQSDDAAPTRQRQAASAELSAAAAFRTGSQPSRFKLFLTHGTRADPVRLVLDEP